MINTNNLPAPMQIDQTNLDVMHSKKRKREAQGSDLKVVEVARLIAQSIEELPTEMLQHIFCYLSFNEQYTMRALNRAFYHFVTIQEAKQLKVCASVCSHSLDEETQMDLIDQLVIIKSRIYNQTLKENYSDIAQCLKRLHNIHLKISLLNTKKPEIVNKMKKIFRLTFELRKSEILTHDKPKSKQLQYLLIDMFELKEITLLDDILAHPNKKLVIKSLYQVVSFFSYSDKKKAEIIAQLIPDERKRLKAQVFYS